MPKRLILVIIAVYILAGVVFLVLENSKNSEQIASPLMTQTRPWTREEMLEAEPMSLLEPSPAAELGETFLIILLWPLKLFSLFR